MNKTTSNIPKSINCLGIFSISLLSSFPILYLVAVNLGQISFIEIVRPICISWGIFYLFYGTINFFYKDSIKSVVLVWLIVLIFFSYGHLYQSMSGIAFPFQFLSRARILIPGTILLILFALRVLQNPRIKLKRFVESIIVTSFLLVISQLYPIIQFVIQSRQEIVISQYGSTTGIVLQPIDTPLDIYYIIVDGYGREDILLEKYKFDNHEFLQKLNKRGFYIADQSHSNYSATILSLASSLSMEYIHVLTERGNKPIITHAVYQEIIANNLVVNLFNELGYQTVSWKTKYPVAQASNSEVLIDLTIEQHSPFLTAFEDSLLDTTLLRAFRELKILSGFRDWLFFEKFSLSESYITPHDEHRTIIEKGLKILPEIAKNKGNKFIFAHIISPHPPFVFDQFGNAISPLGGFTLEDGSSFPGTQEDYLSGYINQLEYLNSQLIIIVDQILENSTSPPVIIIQGDHGPGLDLVKDSIEETDLQERLSIFNAYYFPDQDYQNLYPTISPVNTFRIIFNQFFGGEFTLYDDRQFFIVSGQWDNFPEVTEQLSKK